MNAKTPKKEAKILFGEVNVEEYCKKQEISMEESDRFADARDQGMSVEDVFKRIRLSKNCSDIFSVFSLVEELRQGLQRKSEDTFYFGLRLVVLDSITPLFMPILGGCVDDKANSFMTSLTRMLRNLAREYDIAVLVTNSVENVRSTTNPMSAFASTTMKPALKTTWTYMPDVTLFLTLGEDVGLKQRVYVNRQGNEVWGLPRVCEVLRSHTGGKTEFFPISDDDFTAQVTATCCEGEVDER
ncbi:355_t:CDS:2 [Acaulospora colombiana]|uniref:355_t:CDS:1 n=1 Tax=Acaulospora colombiana TaxID=27376 RepID=A0ACA9MPT1_9GLOM|nr:355_t:CDS:2 [Acaulospora colombiana]